MPVTITRTAWTDNNGTPGHGTVINNAEKTAIYDQIDAALALLLPLTGGALSGSLSVPTNTRLYLDGGGDTYLIEEVGNRITFASGGANRAHINSIGFGYGVVPSYALHVEKDVTGSIISSISNLSATDPLGINVGFPNASPNNAANYFMRFLDSAATRFYLMSNGGLHNFSANNVNLSDDSAKDYDAPLTEADIDKEVQAFLSLEIRRGKYKDAKGSETTLMFSAQQVERTKKEWTTEFDAERKLKGTREHAILMAAYATIRQIEQRVKILEAA